MSTDLFHPAVASWFHSSFVQATRCQHDAWPSIQAGRHTLITAPTGSGKTLAAFLAAIDGLIKEALAGPLPDTTCILYVSPLKALSNDIHRNLEAPLDGIRVELDRLGQDDPGIRTAVRTGDTPQAARAQMRRNPPHILVTTPESLYILLTSESGRKMLAGVRSVIVDEIHALAGCKRGSHLALSLERLRALVDGPLQRIGLSATVAPVDEVTRFLIGTDEADCAIVDTGHVRRRDLCLELPDSPLSAVMSNEVWEEVYGRLAELASEHRTTLVFVNTRRMAERLAHHLSEHLGEEQVSSHHGSLSRAQRLAAEQRLKDGELKALVATASLELGIDIGDVDLVCQVGATRSITTFLQRIGRAGHQVGGVPRGRLFPLTRDELVEAAALLDAIRREELDRLIIPTQPLDVLAQQIVAEIACGERGEDELYALVRRAWPYRSLEREDFDAVLRMLTEGFSTRRGRRSTWLHRDAVNHRLRPRKGARLTAITCGGAIPDTADYEVRLEPGNTFVGTLDEDFAIESMAGDIFQLGNTSWRILRVESGTVRVEDARGAPPNIPFWFGEAPARTREFSHAVSRLRESLAMLFPDRDVAAAWLCRELGLTESAARQMCDYLAAGMAALGAMPSQDTLVLERFFDESGGMQLVLHSPFGARLNRAWGLALRKRFCRQFNFELQAAATEDAIVLSLGETHSFPLADVWRFLNPETVREVLTQALLDAPVFPVRWRWNASCALALPRFQGGRKVPPRLQRMKADDLVAVVFPDQLACFENISGSREIPDHPLVAQTLKDCLTEVMDIEALEGLLGEIAAGNKTLIERDLTGPSPLAQEILNASPYAFLDGAPLEERRTQAVIARRWLEPQEAADLGRLDAAAIKRVREEVWPRPGTADELHDALLVLGFVTAAEGRRNDWEGLFEVLRQARRAVSVQTREGGPDLWFAVEGLMPARALYPGLRLADPVTVPEEFACQEWCSETALVALLRNRLDGLGPVDLTRLSADADLPQADIEAALLALEQQGYVLRGRFTGRDTGEWCERRLLARIHHYTVGRLRADIEPVSGTEFMRFLFAWQHVTPGSQLRGAQSLAAIITQLEGVAVAAGVWESEILRARMEDYSPAMLDQLCLSGQVTWRRPQGTAAPAAIPRSAMPIRSTPVALFRREAMAHWSYQADSVERGSGVLGAGAQCVNDYLDRHGASFFHDLVSGTGLLRSQVESALAELVARGWVNADSFAGLRALLKPARGKAGSRRRRALAAFSAIDQAGRWSLLPSMARADADLGEEVAKTIAGVLLRRYGVVFKRLLEREQGLPPWRELYYCLRRMEARGEIRGGRFVAGVSGEQFALPEAVTALRQGRRKKGPQELVICAADPLNLHGILTSGERIPALGGNRLLYRDGELLAVLVSGRVNYIGQVPEGERWAMHNRLVRVVSLGACRI